MSELRKILYADDEADLRRVVSMVLRKLGGFEVELCEDGAQALAAAERFAPDLILLDVMMPVMTGPEALEKLRENAATADIPVAFITAKVRPQDLEKLKSGKRIGVLTKPFESEMLSDQVRALWEELSAEPMN